ncbi:Hypothetical_protein [Hexamita inflata]|uniref:Hypothetical_protein n=1 Tax=Hexamita inflata TaxID=28002 RepID=A0AA86R389_9EUKA|nr:Hypothetical protein HINF_LOCUS53861 [Hexamita inflata]
MFYLFNLNLIYMESISIVAQQQCMATYWNFLVILASHQTIIDVQLNINLHQDRLEKCNHVTNLVLISESQVVLRVEVHITYKWRCTQLMIIKVVLTVSCTKIITNSIELGIKFGMVSFIK